jgi:hypothetical protein
MNDDDLVKLTTAKARLEAADARWLALLAENDLTGIEDALMEMRAARAAMLDLVVASTAVRDVLSDHRMADDYNPETGENDGIKYWERPGWEPGHDTG